MTVQPGTLFPRTFRGTSFEALASKQPPWDPIPGWQLDLRPAFLMLSPLYALLALNQFNLRLSIDA